VMKTYIAMGSPRYPTRAQVQQMNAASALPAPAHLALRAGTLNIDLKPNELLLLHIGAAPGRHKRPTSNHTQE
jgi:hypothetical protein